MNLADQRERGQKADKLLTDPLFAQAFADARQVIFDAWEQAPVRDKEGAHELKLMLKLLGDVRAILERAITDGKIAAAELVNQERRDLSPAQFRANHLRR
jgi:hypothetical protein